MESAEHGEYFRAERLPATGGCLLPSGLGLEQAWRPLTERARPRPAMALSRP
jgi:hypothetical protein